MTNLKATNITWHEDDVTQTDYELLLGQKCVAPWFTGLLGLGKSTLFHAVEEKLFEKGHLTYVLDRDNVRHILNKNPRFSPKDREETFVKYEM